MIKIGKKNTEEVESISSRTFTQADRKDLAGETNRSTIKDHEAKENHVVNWSDAKILDKSS